MPICDGNLKVLRFGLIGGLGLMGGPMSNRLYGQNLVQIARVFDRGRSGEKRDHWRSAWLNHGATLVSSMEALVGHGDLDGVIVCCGKNGDDCPIIARLVVLLSQCSEQARLICHMSTVSPSFALAAQEFSDKYRIEYVNYPLTGAPLGVETGKLLILASGKTENYQRLLPLLNALGQPKYFGNDPAKATRMKLIGHTMVFNGLFGTSSAIAAESQLFRQADVGGSDQASIFDFLNGGAGGNRQWELLLSAGIRNGIWDMPFKASHAVVDSIYTADMLIENGVSRLCALAIINVGLAFSFIVNKYGNDVAAHAMVRELTSKYCADFDAFYLTHSPNSLDMNEHLTRLCLSLPNELMGKVRLALGPEDFERQINDVNSSIS